MYILFKKSQKKIPGFAGKMPVMARILAPTDDKSWLRPWVHIRGCTWGRVGAVHLRSNLFLNI